MPSEVRKMSPNDFFNLLAYLANTDEDIRKASKQQPR